MATISNPFVMEVPRKLTDEELVNAIRQDIIGELEAIHEYDAHVQATDNEDAKKVLSDIRDETDRTGMRIVIEVKHDANPQVVLNRLFAQTQLQTSFAINMLALVDNQKQPKILSLRHIIDEYLTFQEELITRRTQYDLKKAREREHLLQGLLIAQDNIDEVIHIIRTSYDDAKEKLMERFSLSDIQAQAILDMRLKALQGLDREKLQNEFDELEKKIAYFVELLSNETMLKGVLKDELLEIRDKYGDERKTEIQEVEDEIDIEDLIEEEQCVFTLTRNGYIKRTSASEYTAQSKGGMGKKGITTREEDSVVDVFTASTHDYILFFTDTGKVYRKKGYQIPESGKAAKGTNIVNIIQVETGERVQAMIHFRDLSAENLFLTMVTRNGIPAAVIIAVCKALSGFPALRQKQTSGRGMVMAPIGIYKIIVHQDDCACLLGDIGSIFAHRNTNICLLDRWRVIDSVSGHCHDVSLRFKPFDNAQLVCRCHPCKHADFGQLLQKAFVVHPFYLCTGQYFAAWTQDF